MADEIKAIATEFHDVVNVGTNGLSSWLETEESREVGQKDDGEESVGHQAGRRIVELPGKQWSEYTEDDLAQSDRGVG